MDANQKATALVITDPQNDFLSPSGVTWGLVGESPAARSSFAPLLLPDRGERDFVEHIEALW